MESPVAPSPSSRQPGGLRDVFVLALPVMLSHLSEALMGVVDSAMVGRLGSTELAAVGFAAVWLMTVFSLVAGTASGVQTFVSQAYGAGDTKACGGWGWQGLYAVLPMGMLLVVAVSWLAAPALQLQRGYQSLARGLSGDDPPSLVPQTRDGVCGMCRVSGARGGLRRLLLILLRSFARR